MALSEMLHIDPDNVPRNKLIVYAAQITLGLVIFIMEIVVFTATDSKITGNNAWPFGLCFLSIPAWIYLALAPRHERTRRAANPNVMLVVDSVFIVLWLSAFASQAAYNTANLCGNACAVSKAIVGLGFIETLLWVLSTLISAYTLRFYQQNGDLPGYEKIGSSQDIDPHKSAFNTNDDQSDDIRYPDPQYPQSEDAHYPDPQYPPDDHYPDTHYASRSSRASDDYYPDHYGMTSTSSRHPRADPYGP